MNRFSGWLAQELGQDPKACSFIEQIDSNTHIVIIDSHFRPSDCIMSGAPSLHFLIEMKDEHWVFLVYLDTKSTTVTGGYSRSKENPLFHWVKDNVWEDTQMYHSSGASIQDVLEEIEFYQDFQIPILGFGVSSEQQFETIQQMCASLPSVFTEEETERLGIQTILSNIVAVENKKYSEDASLLDHYIIPNVGMGEWELWLGTNPSFFVQTIGDEDTQSCKVAKNHLFHMVFFRFCHYLSQKYGMIVQPISKIEKSFDMSGIPIDKLRSFLSDLYRFNHSAIGLFILDMKEVCETLGDRLYRWVQRFDRLSAFYNDTNLISLLVYSISDEDPNYFGISTEWIEHESKELNAEIAKTVGFIDEKIKTIMM